MREPSSGNSLGLVYDKVLLKWKTFCKWLPRLVNFGLTVSLYLVSCNLPWCEVTPTCSYNKKFLSQQLSLNQSTSSRLIKPDSIRQTSGFCSGATSVAYLCLLHVTSLCGPYSAVQQLQNYSEPFPVVGMAWLTKHLMLNCTNLFHALLNLLCLKFYFCISISSARDYCFWYLWLR